MSADHSPTLHFWFDPLCPFTWATSTWARQAAAARGGHISWHIMSLAVLNENKSVPPQAAAAMAASWRPIRLLSAAAQHAPGSIGALYEAIGRKVHIDKQPVDDALLSEALEQAGLPASLLAAADDAAQDEAVRHSHQHGQDRVGVETGSPITAYDDGPAFFGPVVTPAPTGAAALDLWDALVLIAGVKELSELRRARQPL